MKQRVDIKKFEKDLQEFLEYSRNPNLSSEEQDWLLKELPILYNKIEQLRDNFLAR